MALWTPYAQEALDLSKPAVKVETVSPLPAYCAPTIQSPLLSERYPASVYYAPNPPFQSASYQYQQASCTSQSASYPQHQRSYPSSTSPESIASWSNCNPPMPSPSYASESAEMYDSLTDDAEFQAFERDTMRAMAEKNGGVLLGNNPRMRRAVQSTQTGDDSYRKQRERNNIAAKMSRDRRKLRKMRLALECTYLKKKIAELRAKVSAGVCGRCGQIKEC